MTSGEDDAGDDAGTDTDVLVERHRPVLLLGELTTVSQMIGAHFEGWSNRRDPPLAPPAESRNLARATRSQLLHSR